MPLQYAAGQERRVEELDREALISDFPVRSAVFKWPASLYVLVRQMTALSAESVSRATAGKVVGSAICRLGAICLDSKRLDGLVLGYRSIEVDSLVTKPIDRKTLKKLPQGQTSFSLPEPVHILTAELQQTAHVTRPINLSELAGMAVCELARQDEGIGDTVLKYNAATVGEIFPEPR
jgi:hypothetical protein